MKAIIEKKTEETVRNIPSYPLVHEIKTTLYFLRIPIRHYHRFYKFPNVKS